MDPPATITDDVADAHASRFSEDHSSILDEDKDFQKAVRASLEEDQANAAQPSTPTGRRRERQERLNVKKRCMSHFEAECVIQQVLVRLGVDIVLCDVLDLIMNEKMLLKSIKRLLHLEEIDRSHPTILKKRVIWSLTHLESHHS